MFGARSQKLSIPGAQGQPLGSGPVELEPLEPPVLPVEPLDVSPPVEASPVVAPVPAVIRQREALAAEIETPAAQPEAKSPSKSAEVTPIKRDTARPKKQMVISRVPANSTKAKAAFTLRLNADRHLRLRLACAVSNRSAQQIVTEALDNFLATIAELDSLAGQVPARNAG